MQGQDKRRLEMRCPRCSEYSLRRSDEAVACGRCGYRLSPGESDKFRLFEMLRSEEEGNSGSRKRFV